MSEKLRLAVIALHISAVLYAILGIFLALLSFFFFLSLDSYPERSGLLALAFFLIFLTLLCFALASLVEFIIFRLRQLRYWAWIAGLIFGGLYLASLFLPLGIMIFVGLLDANVRNAFESELEKNTKNLTSTAESDGQ